MNFEELIKETQNDPELSERDKLIKERDFLREALENKKIKDEIISLRKQLHPERFLCNGDVTKTIKPTVITDESLEYLIDRLFGGR